MTFSVQEVRDRLDGDLGAISREATLRHHELTGRTFGTVQLGGTSQGILTSALQQELPKLDTDALKRVMSDLLTCAF